MKANEMGRAIRDDERAGKAEEHLIDAGEVRCPEKLCEFLGDDIPDELPEEAPETAPPKGKGSQPSGEGKLYKISEEDGEVGYELVSDQPPYSQSMLEADAVYILGSPAGPAGYIWKGKDSSQEKIRLWVSFIWAFSCYSAKLIIVAKLLWFREVNRYKLYTAIML